MKEGKTFRFSAMNEAQKTQLLTVRALVKRDRVRSSHALLARPYATHESC